jgi:N-acetylneuraminate synthase
MSSLDEIDRSVSVVREVGAPVAVLQCTTAYPCPPERVGVNVLPEFSKRFNCPVGLSDHSGTIYPALAAAVLGASVIEVHVALTREQFGPDVPASVTTPELSQLVEGIRFIETMMDNPVDKDEAFKGMSGLRDTFTKSLYTVRAMQPGETITAADLTVKKPGTGIPAAEFDVVVGRKINLPVGTGHMLAKSDIV